MNKEQLIKNIESVAATLVATLKRKNADYGSSFSTLYERIGMPYAYGHLAEKLERIWSLMNRDAQVKDESLKDSLYDLAGYAILTLAHAEQKSALESEKTAKNAYFTDDNPARFKVNDFIYRVNDNTNVVWQVKDVTSTYILVGNGENVNLIYPYEQDDWARPVYD